VANRTGLHFDFSRNFSGIVTQEKRSGEQN
jgi:hypothetical protein